VSTTIGATRRNVGPVSYYELRWIRRQSALSIIGAILKRRCCTFVVFPCIVRSQIGPEAVLFAIFSAYSRSFYCAQKTEFNPRRQEIMIPVPQPANASQCR
jgi:hypothetical protein